MSMSRNLFNACKTMFKRLRQTGRLVGRQARYAGRKAGGQACRHVGKQACGQVVG